MLTSKNPRLQFSFVVLENRTFLERICINFNYVFLLPIRERFHLLRHCFWQAGHAIRLASLSALSTKGLFTWSGGSRSSGFVFFCFHALGDTKHKKPTPLDRGPPLHVNRVLLKNLSLTFYHQIVYYSRIQFFLALLQLIKTTNIVRHEWPEERVARNARESPSRTSTSTSNSTSYNVSHCIDVDVVRAHSIVIGVSCL